MDDKETNDQAHRAEAGQQLSSVGRRLFKYVEFDENEQLIAEIRKHPVGIVAILLVASLVSLAVMGVGLFLASNLDNLGFNSLDGNGSAKAAIAGVSLILIFFTAVVATISIILYRLNVVYITNEKVAEVAYYTIFNRKTTQLGIGQIEDATVQQKGIFARVFGYATLIVETAGEKENATFSLVPQPNLHSQQIVEAHEKYVEKYGN